MYVVVHVLTNIHTYSCAAWQGRLKSVSIQNTILIIHTDTYECSLKSSRKHGRGDEATYRDIQESKRTVGFCVACTPRVGGGCEKYFQYSECTKNISEPEVQKVSVSNGFDSPKTDITFCVRVH